MQNPLRHTTKSATNEMGSGSHRSLLGRRRKPWANQAVQDNAVELVFGVIKNFGDITVSGTTDHLMFPAGFEYSSGQRPVQR